MQIKTSKGDIIWNYIGIIMSMASNLLLLPFYINFLDSEILGLWYVYLSIGAIVTLFDFGFNPTLARNVAYCWTGVQKLQSEGVIEQNNKNTNFALLKTLISTCRKIYFIIAAIGLFVLLTIGLGYIYSISKEICSSNIILSWLIYSAAVSLNLYYGYFVTLLRGVGAVSQYNKINVISRVIQIITAIILLILGKGILAVSLAYFIYGVALRLFSNSAFFKYKNIGQKLLEVGGKTSTVEIKQTFKTIWHNAWRDGVVAISNYCASQASTLIASAFLSLTETGIYSISVQLVTAVATISFGLYSTYQPAMQSSYAAHNKKEARKLISVSMIAYFCLFHIGIVGLIFIGIPLLKVIKPENIYEIPVILGISIYTFFYIRQILYSSFISNTNHVPYMKAYIITSVVAVLFCIIFTKYLKLGVWGLILGQFLPQIVYNCWKWPNEVIKMLDTTWGEFLSLGIKKSFLLLKGIKNK